MSNRLSVVMIAKTPPTCCRIVWAPLAGRMKLSSSTPAAPTTPLSWPAASAPVYTHTDWRGYGIQRQRAQDYATGDWVLMIDTDERVTPELRQAILKVLDAPSAAPSTASPAVTIFSDALCATAVGIPIASCACTNAPVTAITIIWSMNRWIARALRLFR